MSLIVKQHQTEYHIPPEGLFEAVCVDAVDIGTVDTPWGPKEKVSLIFELDQVGPDGSRYIVGKRYTKSLSEKSNLYQDLTRWRTRKFNSGELEKGFDLESLIGISALVYISHNETENRTYANITSILPPKKSEDENPNWFETRPSGEYVRVIERDDYMPPEEYAASQNGTN